MLLARYRARAISTTCRATTGTNCLHTFVACGVQEEAKQEVLRLESDLSKGKKAALNAIARLEANARDMREEAAAMREEQRADHQAKMAALNGEV